VQGKKKLRSERGITIRAVWDINDQDASESFTEENEPLNDPTDAGSLEDGGLPVEALPSTVYSKAAHRILEEECRICYCGLEDGETVCILANCGHVFHRECLAPWIIKQATCPLCSASLLEA
jgi:hypothetical protein